MTGIIKIFILWVIFFWLLNINLYTTNEFDLVVTDSYDAETLETVTIEVGGEPNKFPAGSARAYENTGN